jgi:hypothetical protein
VRRARRSLHEELIVKYFQSGNKDDKPRHFMPASWDRHPGVSVVDVNGDGFDDFYVMTRWSRNMFFRNRGDGTFEEVAEILGLDLEGHTSSAVFADFDNDGDPDVFVGRTLSRSMYLVNEAGHFVDRSSQLVDQDLPYMVSSVSAADYDNDGLLDVYFSTYAASFIERKVDLGEYLPSNEVDELQRLLGSGESHTYLSRPGPPNFLLKSLGGGRFGKPDDVPELHLYRNTYQSTWGDYDGDGDQDLYVANDFAPNNMFRNDGEGAFTDVTSQTATADIGFGMGAAWGITTTTDGRIFMSPICIARRGNE